MEDFKNDIAKKGGNIKLSYEPQSPLAVVVDADRGRITQVISNLLSNAIKFTKEGSISINVATKRRNEDAKNNSHKEEVVVSLEDTGTGIDSEILPRLFTKLGSDAWDYLFQKVSWKLMVAKCGLRIIIIIIIIIRLIMGKKEEQHFTLLYR
jgi:K+-sensing histidine kinase KdpD